MPDTPSVRNTIRTNSETNLTTGFVRLGHLTGGPAPAAKMIHDGDTIAVRAAGNLSIRLLGIDTPEVSFSVGGRSFVPLSDPLWERFLTSPFDDARWGEFERPLAAGLKRWLESRVGPGAAAAHLEHAHAAEDAFKKEVERDQQVMGKDDASFQFFLVFGFDVMDGYGRLLCLINRDQPQRTVPAPRPPTYNFRLLEQGRAFPYFIWPNINPWDKPESITDAVLKPGAAATSMEANDDIRRARAAVQSAREQHRGLFNATSPLLLEPFELRFLARRSPPGRYVIDLAKNDDVLIHPQNYHTIPHPEDRLFISSVHVPLFVEHGWKRQPISV